jgi:hypothetical protein
VTCTCFIVLVSLHYRIGTSRDLCLRSCSVDKKGWTTGRGRRGREMRGKRLFDSLLLAIFSTRSAFNVVPFDFTFSRSFVLVDQSQVTIETQSLSLSCFGAISLPTRPFCHFRLCMMCPSFVFSCSFPLSNCHSSCVGRIWPISVDCSLFANFHNLFRLNFCLPLTPPSRLC